MFLFFSSLIIKNGNGGDVLFDEGGGAPLYVRFKLCQAEKPSPIRDCDGIPRVGQGAVGHFPSCMI